MNKMIGIATLLVACGGAWAGAQEDDLINLARSGIEEEVLISYIDAAKGPYHLTTDQIIELKDLGASPKAISEALKHGTPENATAAPERSQVSATTADTSESSKKSANAFPASPVVTTPESMSVAPPVAPPLDTAAPPKAVAPPPPPPEMVAPAPGDQNISFFYQSLYPYGTWINVDGQWCWRPNAASLDLNWTPYCSNGYWAYTDWGWFWVSNYSWGWAPFHYGRWFRHAGYGWVWMPGTEWGPAWVSFRSCYGYFGWAPLPPAAYFVDRRGFFFNGRLAVGGIDFGLTAGDYRFVPAGRFADRDVWLHIVPTGRVEGFFGRTTIMRDNYRISDDRVFNRGPSVEMVSRSAGRRITPLTIESSQLRPGERIHGIIRSDRGLTVYRPMISKEAPESPLTMEKRYGQGRSGGGGERRQGPDQGSFNRGNRGGGGMYPGNWGHQGRPDDGERDRDRDRR